MVSASSRMEMVPLSVRRQQIDGVFRGIFPTATAFCLTILCHDLALAGPKENRECVELSLLAWESSLQRAMIWRAPGRLLLCGENAVGELTLFDCLHFPVRIAAEVRDFNATLAMSTKEARQSSRFVQFASLASKQAVLDSGSV